MRHRRLESFIFKINDNWLESIIFKWRIITPQSKQIMKYVDNIEGCLLGLPINKTIVRDYVFDHLIGTSNGKLLKLYNFVLIIDDRS